MYTFVYDTFVSDKRHERLLSRIETRLTDLGISGRIERLTMFKDLGEVVEDAIARGSETIVAVGNDITVGRLVTALADTTAALGIVPVGDGPHAIADMLGIEPDVEACNILSRRVLQTIDLGKINDHYFLSSVEIPRTKASFSCNGRYDVIPTQDNEVRICNLAAVSMSETESRVTSPRDGYLETVFRPAPARGLFSRFFRQPVQEERPTVVPVKRMTIKHQNPFIVYWDGNRMSSNTLNIEIVPKKLRVVTGKGRKFE
jgi:diacylglycerol kinase family enzyme